MYDNIHAVRRLKPISARDWVKRKSEGLLLCDITDPVAGYPVHNDHSIINDVATSYNSSSDKMSYSFGNHHLSPGDLIVFYADGQVAFISQSAETLHLPYFKLV